MMKRRDFLKKLGIVCGAAVACPTKLLKGEPEWVRYARCFGPENEIMLNRLRTASKWPKYHAHNRFTITQQNQLIIELEKTFWNTKFQSPFIMLQIDP